MGACSSSSALPANEPRHPYVLALVQSFEHQSLKAGVPGILVRLTSIYIAIKIKMLPPNATKADQAKTVRQAIYEFSNPTAPTNDPTHPFNLALLTLTMCDLNGRYGVPAHFLPLVRMAILSKITNLPPNATRDEVVKAFDIEFETLPAGFEGKVDAKMKEG